MFETILIVKGPLMCIPHHHVILQILTKLRAIFPYHENFWMLDIGQQHISLRVMGIEKLMGLI